MPQTEVLIHVVLEGDHKIDPDGQLEVMRSTMGEIAKAAGGGVEVSRYGIEVRPVDAPEAPAAPEVAAEPQAPAETAAEAPQAPAPAAPTESPAP